MVDEAHFRNLENVYLSARCNEYYQPRIRISEGEAEIEIDVEEKYFHAANAVHGSVYFKMLDDAAYFAVNSLVPDVFVLTVSFHLHLLRPISRGTMRAVGKAYFTSKQLYAGESVLLDDRGREIARGNGLFALSKMKLPVK
ncbi:MAG: PaaI family thioesterase [Calditrichaeota bacterium]|nr:MAG: PaaI family thioesterase [Calditrichota bacterium]